ncbi:NAD(P)H-hydrate dehydratase [Actinocorallia sp. A-T 12471]|uniref:NAD(P)H-hydrate dehydratase n=1 Tax=Actinocorallia sp. A-T 12471 TaxID=3089813 RepID=UPI0029CC5F5E|nr:NAD(P)H-hydrate dehydratase [Actinocorallia sp. A-T 12471]MDX6738353.1 NAD(P)H-hydrate dehydratase [Actinocorallia sp. A-T 12471]
MRYAHAVDEVRAAEAALMARLPEGTLMQRAAAGLASVCAQLLGRLYGSRVLLLVGSGDNGGDALYAGARLARRGAHVTAALAAPKAHADALTAFRQAGGRVIDHTRLEPLLTARHPFQGTDLVIDGLTGIGGRGSLRGLYGALVAALPDDAAVVACDVPSGVDADTGEVAGEAVRADVTVTFGTLKPGLLIDPGADHAGVVELIDIGLSGLPAPTVIAPSTSDVRPPRPAAETDKYRRGVVGVIAGGSHYTGAALLSVGSALRGGAGMVRFASAARVVGLVEARWPETVTAVLPDDGEPDLEAVGRVQAWVVGPGLGVDERGERLVKAVLRTDVPVLVDADGLTVLAELPAGERRALLDRPAATLLTPHAGELSRLTNTGRDQIEARRLASVRAAAADLGVTVLLKGSTTLVADPGGPVRANLTGTPWLATAGSGDVLSGLAGSLLAQGVSAVDAGAWAAHLHGLAARIAAAPRRDRAPAPITAEDVLAALPEAFAQLP